MRGVDYFPREDETEWRRLYDRALQHWQIQQQAGRPVGRDFVTHPTTLDEYTNVYNTLTDQNDYPDWRQRRDRELEGERVFWKGVDQLDLNALTEVQLDRPRLQPFKLKYDTLDEVKMRLNKTVILVKGHPFFVTDQRHIKDEFYVLLEGIGNKKSYLPVAEIPDLRPASPCYVKVSETNGYLSRVPARVNQQGMTSQTVHIQRIGQREYISFSQQHLVEALTSRGKTLPWEKSYRRLIDDRIVSTFRLSDTLALYKKPTQESVLVEYKGRRLGTLEDHTIKVFDEDDVIQPWLKSEVNKVNLEIGQ